MGKRTSGSQGDTGAGARGKTQVESKGGPGVQQVERRARERLISGCSVRFCENWYDCECENISNSTYNTLKNEKAVHWYCAACNKGLVKILKNLKLMQTRQDKMDEKLGKLKGEMAEIKCEMTQIRTMAMENGTKVETAIEAKLLESMQQSMIGRVDGQMQSMREDVQKKVIERVTESMESVQRNVLSKVSESMEIEKRKLNLILHGIKESENGEDVDIDLVNEILRSISIYYYYYYYY